MIEHPDDHQSPVKEDYQDRAYDYLATIHPWSLQGIWRLSVLDAVIGLEQQFLDVILIF